MKCVPLVSMVLVLVSLMPLLAMAGWGRETLKSVENADLIYIATLRKDGTHSDAAPLWFGVLDDVIWVNTGANSVKVRRIERGSPVFFSTQEKGPFTEAKAEIVRDGAIADRLGEQYRRKYWIAWLGFFRPKASRVAAGKTVLIKLTPRQ